MVAAAPPLQRPSLPPLPNVDLPEPHAAVTEAADETEMPLPSDPRTFFLGGFARVGCLGGALPGKLDHSSRRTRLRVEPPSSTRCPSLRAGASASRCLDRPPGYWSAGRSCGGLISAGLDLG
jgi:hypothetical protein